MARDLKLDGLKCIMMYLVVLVHLGFNDYGLGVALMTDAFHMPVFIFLSGYFTSQNTAKEKQVRWLRHTLLVYAMAQLAHFALSLALGYIRATLDNTAFDMGVFSWKVFVSPYFALWYLVCLVYWKWSAWRMGPKTNDAVWMWISCVLAIVAGFIPVDHDFSFQRAFAFYPFFVMGTIFRKRNLLPTLNRVPVPYAAIVLVAGLLAARCFPHTYMPKFHYANGLDLVHRIAQTGLGMVLCLTVLRMAQVFPVEKLSSFGRHTLWIYIGHTYLIRIGLLVLPLWNIRLNLFTAPVVAFVYCAFFIFLAKLYHSWKAKTASGAT